MKIRTLIITLLMISFCASASEGESSKRKMTELFCGLIKSAYLKESNIQDERVALVTVVSQNRVIKISSTPLARKFIKTVYPFAHFSNIELNQKETVAVTWASSGMNEFYQICLRNLVTQKISDDSDMEFSDHFESFEIIN